jgi:16S rRNA (cytosine967-C5)-methyltransferase
VLTRVEKDRSFAAAVLEAELGSAVQLDPRDRALATELVYGSLRVQPWLLERIARYATKGLARVDVHTRAHLVLGAYQLFFLSRVPPFAAVSEAVEAVRRTRGAPVAAFANAVLRKLSADAAESRKAGESGSAPDLLLDAIVTSAAPWLREALERALGHEGAAQFLAAGREAPPVTLRVEDASARDAWLARLRAEVPSARFEVGSVSPHAIVARGAGKPQALPGWSEGALSVQEEGSQVIALALGAQPGEAVLDACAGRGNKTSLLAHAVGERGAVDAADLHASKLERLTSELARVGVAPRATYAVDWSVGPGDVSALYDRVLVDAPCSGVGTLRRRPELQTRRTAEDPRALAVLQQAIVARAADRVRPGGRLVYAVCSVLREESEDVVEALLAARPDLEPCPFEAGPLRTLAGDGSTLRLLPHVHGTDGYFVASFRRRAA